MVIRNCLNTENGLVTLTFNIGFQSEITIDQLHVVRIYHFLKAQNFPVFLVFVT